MIFRLRLGHPIKALIFMIPGSAIREIKSGSSLSALGLFGLGPLVGK